MLPVFFDTPAISYLLVRVIGVQTLADAITSRIIHDAHQVGLQGESLDKKKD